MRQKAIHPDLLVSLKKELEYCFGKKIVSYRDCIQLVEDIQQKTGFSVNVNTIRRFFGLVKTKYTASASTLSIFSKYCGFNSIEDIGVVANRAQYTEQVHKKEILRYLVNLYETLPTVDEFMHVGCNIVEQTLEFLERNPELIEPFQREIAETEAGQYYYFEKMVNIDQLNGYYGEGLRYYLRSKNTSDAKILTDALQCVKGYFKKDSAYIEKHYKLLNSTVLQDVKPHIQAWQIAAQLCYNYITNKPPDDALSEAYKHLNNLVEKRRSRLYIFPDYEIIISTFLCLNGHLDEALQFLKECRSITEKKKLTTSRYYNNLFQLFSDYLQTSETSPYLPLSPNLKKKSIGGAGFNKNLIKNLNEILSKAYDNKFN